MRRSAIIRISRIGGIVPSVKFSPKDSLFKSMKDYLVILSSVVSVPNVERYLFSLVVMQNTEESKAWNKEADN